MKGYWLGVYVDRSLLDWDEMTQSTSGSDGVFALGDHDVEDQLKRASRLRRAGQGLHSNFPLLVSKILICQLISKKGNGIVRYVDERVGARGVPYLALGKPGLSALLEIRVQEPAVQHVWVPTPEYSL